MVFKEKKISLFKTYLRENKSYKGGKSRSEVTSDKKIYKLSSNENLLGPSPKAIEAIRNNLHLVNEYPDRTDERLQIALSEFYKRQLSPGQFITSNSGVEMLELIIRAFLAEGLECIFSNPAFEPYRMFPAKLGAVAKNVPLIGDNFDLDVNGIIQSITDNTRLIFITSPNNPTGTHIPKAQLDLLVAQLPKHVILVYDEVYYQFAKAADYTTALPYVQAGHQVIAVNSFSKAYGLAGLRMGYAYAPLDIAQYVSRVRRPFMLSTLVLEASIAALDDQEFIAQTVKTVDDGKKYLYTALDQFGIKYWKSEANFILIKPEMEDILFEEKMLEEGIMVRPVANFGAPGCIRVTVGTEEANQAFVRALGKVVGY